MPSLADLTTLFDVLPDVPPPIPRARRKLPANYGGDKSQGKTPRKDVHTKNLDAGGGVTTASAPSTSISWFSMWPFRKQPTQRRVESTPERRPHPMAAIKQGKKVAIIAVVDAGSPSFFRFGQGEFSEWPMVG